MTGNAGHRGDPGTHFEAGPRDAVTDRVLDRVLPGAGNPGAVAEEDHVEAAAFGGASSFLEHADIRVMLIDPGTRKPPLGLHVGPRHVEGQVNSLFHAAAPVETQMWLNTGTIPCTVDAKRPIAPGKA